MNFYINKLQKLNHNNQKIKKIKFKFNNKSNNNQMNNYKNNNYKKNKKKMNLKKKKLKDKSLSVINNNQKLKVKIII